MTGVGVALVLVGLLLSHRGLDRIEQCLSSGCHSKIPGTGATDIIPQSSGGCEVQEPDAGWFHSWEWASLREHREPPSSFLSETGGRGARGYARVGFNMF